MENPTPLSFWEQWDSSGLSPDMGLDFNIPLLSNENNNLNNLDTLPAEATEPNLEPSRYQGTQEATETSPLSNINTTLCSLACQWVIQCNTKGVELDVLYFRMESGFKQGNNPLEGCRVDNQVLIKVLTEISWDRSVQFQLICGISPTAWPHKFGTSLYESQYWFNNRKPLTHRPIH